ncbi:MAG: hypothetical protein K9J13_15610, partial [Saprospiraceae bacterium]|nr:hypothetical protein [Saprospiraceae bacterium]
FVITLTFLFSNTYSQNLNHKLNIELFPDKGLISVIDTIVLQKDFCKENKVFYFQLNKELNIKSSGDGFSINKIPDPKDSQYEIYTTKYKIEITKTAKSDLIIPISYEGFIKDEEVKESVEYARSFTETKGKISPIGIHLAGSTYWIPYFENQEFISFSMNVKIDSAWSVVSQGKRTLNKIINKTKIIRYESPEPMDEIYLIAAKWTEYSIMADNILVQAFLRTPDEELANKYLGVTSHYIKLYESLIGKYPFTKFALVENFWQTGYGMPSFTLLGDQIIRFPWILHSSYPHELLHNYWGNSVYVDYEQGNWCEGITAYMADHLIKEQQGQGDEYRMSTIQKFTDYVNDDNDFPVKEFTSRSNPATEAIGYGKCLMFNDMLRQEVGDELFLKAYSKLYNDFKFKKAGFNDILNCFNEVTGKDFTLFFEQWLSRKGAPEIKLSKVVKTEKGITFTLSQTQKEEVFNLNIPVAFYLMDGVIIRRLNLKEREQNYSFENDSLIVKMEVDPQFNVFRRLDKKEVPVTFSQIFGSTDGLIILPKNCPYSDAYKQLAETWKVSQEKQNMKIKIVYDTELKILPSDKTIWILGFENLYAKQVDFSKSHMAYFSDKDKSTIANLKTNGSLVYSLPNPKNESFAIGFIGSNNVKAIPGLTRKLPHYGKYSYLGFEGDAPDNVWKGIFPALDSPLQVQIASKEIKSKASLKPRKALAGN